MYLLALTLQEKAYMGMPYVFEHLQSFNWKDKAPFFHHELLHAYTEYLHVPTSGWYDADTVFRL